METSLTCDAELQAKEAESLRAFGGINLLHVKRQVAILLGLIGRGGIFDEYTRHDISHIDEMLQILDWLIPSKTQSLMSPADWLLVVLSIYFHDLGMLVTRQEFERRNDSGFLEFCGQFLFEGEEGIDYKDKVSKLSSDRQQRFLYQEFVRHNHAQRVKDWILGKQVDYLGVSDDAMNEVDNLIRPLGQQFRKDLALICESHHLDDLADLDKYKVSQPYGNSEEETANLQYAAIILRTADLLQITSDRTPSVAFRVISPSDPVSQEEWAKQMAVKRVRPKIGLDKERNPDPDAPRDTIEVYAYFTSSDGFFGLTSYLSYAEKQLSKSREWIEATQRKKLASHDFPWNWIDETNIETEGFIRDTFKFEIDQARILDLLTGHTLYNDSRVVLRELVQNSLDAIRLQQEIDPTFRNGSIQIIWNSTERILSVQDNGTGMTQKIITDYLLTVGSSRYQDPEFKKQYPDFCPISRFGIGVLSAFMIADVVDIITCHPDEEEARHLSLRSVHGKYLIRLLDKDTDSEAQQLKPHGTLFRLEVRPSAEVPDVLETAKEWVVMPDCPVTVQIDDDPPEIVGFTSPKDALEAQLRERGMALVDDDALPVQDSDRRIIRIVQKEQNGTALAYAVEWNSWFQEWSFLSSRQVPSYEKLLLGTCIGGIRVDSNSPGYDDRGIVAIANLSGPSAPRTNVARYGIESTPERDKMLAQVYRLYCSHIQEEMRKLYGKRAFSLTWSVREAQYLVRTLMRPLIGSGHMTEPLSDSLFQSSLKDIPLVVIETQGKRQACSVNQVDSHPEFWTVDCALFQSIEWLLREIPTDSSLFSVTNALTEQDLELPSEAILCSQTPCAEISQLLFADKEVDKMIVHPQQRRVDLRWVARRQPPRWAQIPDFAISSLVLLSSRGALRPTYLSRNCFIGLSGIDIQTNEQLTGIRSLDRIFLLPNSPIAQYLSPMLQQLEEKPSSEQVLLTAAVLFIAGELLESSRIEIDDPDEHISRLIGMVDREINVEMYTRIPLKELIDVREFCEIVRETRWSLFDPNVWTRESE